MKKCKQMPKMGLLYLFARRTINMILEIAMLFCSADETLASEHGGVSAIGCTLMVSGPLDTCIGVSLPTGNVGASRGGIS